MITAESASPSINANFAATALNRAAELIANPSTRAESDGSVLGALQQARDEFLAAEARKRNSSRTYGLPWLLKDLGEYVKIRHPEHAASFTPISDWNDVTSPGVMAQTLRVAALSISRIVEERTIWASRFEAMSERERSEYELMRKAALFLKQQGLTVNVAWDREDTNDPIDYRGTVDGVAWAFELTELRIDAEGSRVKVGHWNESKSVKQQLEELAVPLLQVRDGPENLQKALNKAAEHGSKASNVAALNGARYCLVVHNYRFLYVSDWEKIINPDFNAFDAVLILHQDSAAAAHTWEVPMQDGFEKPIPSQNASDLSDIAGFKLSGRPGFNPEAIRSFWRRMEESGITEAEIYEIVKEVRADRCRRCG